MQKRTTMACTTLLAVGILLGGLVIPTRGEEKKLEPGAKTVASFTPDQLAERSLHSRAVEAVIWGMPAVNAQLTFDAVKQVGGDFNQIVYWSRPLTWKNQTLTLNPSTIYVFPFYNTKDVGPMVLEIPPANKEDLDHRQRRRRPADGARKTSAPPAWTRAKRGKYLDPAARATKRRCRTVTSRCHRDTYTRLRHPALQPQERKRRRRRQGRRLRQERQVLPAVTGRQSTGDEVRRSAS